jgi:tRNA(Ile)-lysidine synthase
MLSQFKEFIKKEKLFSDKHKILAAVSGGIDSVVFCYLLHKAGFVFGIAHCNFQLRGKESDEDEKFVKELAIYFKVPYYVKKFDTQIYVKKHKVSVQMAARELRYSWFEEMRIKNSFDYIAVAHHQNDEIETFFINLIRGTGIAGLHGIKVKTGNIVRPLMFSVRKEIEEFAGKNNIHYREDGSNSSLKYLRNKIRHKLIPMLKELNPDIENAVKSGIQRIRQMEGVFHEIVEEKKKEIVKQDGSLVKFDIKKLLSLPHNELFLFEFLKPYGFSGDIIGQISKGLKGTSGKIFNSSTHRLVKDRMYLILSELFETDEEKTIVISGNLKNITNPLQLKLKKLNISKNFEVIKDSNIAMLDFDKLSFPLILKKRQKGDYFYPFGMRGKKKLSDFFTDLKLSLPDKENIWLLCNGDDIVWVVGHRIDNRYRITSKTKRVFVSELVRK